MNEEIDRELYDVVGKAHTKECLWCGKEFYAENIDDELCNECAQYDSCDEMMRAKSKLSLKTIRLEGNRATNGL